MDMTVFFKMLAVSQNTGSEYSKLDLLPPSKYASFMTILEFW